MLLLLLCGILVFADPFTEPWRPQVHFSPSSDWINDPCGLTFVNGTYHLFVQYSLAKISGKKEWAHSTSTDLMHWDVLSVSIPATSAYQIYTGSALPMVVDSEPVLAAIYTADYYQSNENQHLTISHDDGKTFVDDHIVIAEPPNGLSGPDVVNFRDPKIMWHEDSKRYVVVVALPDDQKIVFYGSPTPTNSSSWKVLSEFSTPKMPSIGSEWECPNLVFVSNDDSPSGSNWWHEKWILFVSANRTVFYLSGKFDGSEFEPDDEFRKTGWIRMDYGPDFFASQAFNLPSTSSSSGSQSWSWPHHVKSNPIVLSWMGNWKYAEVVPTSPWRGMLNFPRVLSLGAGSVLQQAPHSNIEQLRENKVVSDVTLIPGQLPQAQVNLTFDANLIEIVIDQIELVGLSTNTFELWIHEGGADEPHQKTIVSFEVSSSNTVVCIDRSQSGIIPNEKFLEPICAGRSPNPPISQGIDDIRVLVDWSSVEVFVNQGKVTLTAEVFPKGGPTKYVTLVTGKENVTTMKGVNVYQLKSVHS